MACAGNEIVSGFAKTCIITSIGLGRLSQLELSQTDGFGVGMDHDLINNVLTVKLYDGMTIVSCSLTLVCVFSMHSDTLRNTTPIIITTCRCRSIEVR